MGNPDSDKKGTASKAGQFADIILLMTHSLGQNDLLHAVINIV